MKISRKQLRTIIKETLLLEKGDEDEEHEEEEDVDFDPGELGKKLNVPPKLLKMLNPDIAPANTR